MIMSNFNKAYQSVRGNRKGFSRSDINVDYRQYPVNWYFNSVAEGRIILDSEFQRSGGLWSLEQKGRFIESLIMNLPITPVFLAENYNGQFDIIDGLQRITTISEFVSNKSFHLVGLDFYIDLEGCNFHSLSGFAKRSFSQAVLHASILSPETDSSIKTSIFHRVNTSGTTLNPHEIRVSLYLNTYFYKKLKSHSKELERSGVKVLGKRKKHQELILKIISLYAFGWNNFKGSKKMSTFLDDSMYSLSIMEDDDIDIIFSVYERAVTLIGNYFGDYDPYNNFKGKFSNAIFFSLVHSVMINEVNKFDFLISDYKKILNDREFKNYIVNGSSKISAVYARYEMISRLIC
jgi:hypothetical protein